MNIPVKAEVIKSTGNHREYMVELSHKKGIAYGRFTHIGDQQGEFVFTKGKLPPLSDDIISSVKEEIRRFEILGHVSYKDTLRR